MSIFLFFAYEVQRKRQWLSKTLLLRSYRPPHSPPRPVPGPLLHRHLIIELPRSKVVATAYPDRKDGVPTPAHTLGDDSLLIKYINPRLFAFATLALAEAGSEQAGGDAGALNGKGQDLTVSHGFCTGEGCHEVGEGGSWVFWQGSVYDDCCREHVFVLFLTRRLRCMIEPCYEDSGTEAGLCVLFSVF